MNDDVAEKIKGFNQVIHKAQNLLFIARDFDLQVEAINELAVLATTVQVWKRDCVVNADEDSANLFLGMECVLLALIAELRMWLLLKQGKPEEAWDELITTQVQTADAVRSHEAMGAFKNHARRLSVIEKICFPPQMFMSVGMIVKRQVCTICGQDYENCDHVIGMPYMGEICARRIEDFTVDHVAIVENPANKRCRITEFNDKGGRRNRMTWRLDPGQIEATENDEGEMTCSAKLLEEVDLIR